MVDFLITLFLGFLGIHKFKQGKVGMGVLYIFTFGLFGIGWLLDTIIAFTKINSSGHSEYEVSNFPESYTRVSGCEYVTSIRNPVQSSLRGIQEILFSGHRYENYSAEQIIFSCDVFIGDSIRIIDDCKQLISKTETPATFFDRYSLLLEKYHELARLESYVEFLPPLPSSSLSYYENIRHRELLHLIDRCYNKSLIKADSMKTEKGKRNQFVKAYDSFAQYRHIMSADSQRYLENKFENKLL